MWSQHGRYVALCEGICAGRYLMEAASRLDAMCSVSRVSEEDSIAIFSIQHSFQADLDESPSELVLAQKRHHH